MEEKSRGRWSQVTMPYLLVIRIYLAKNSFWGGKRGIGGKRKSRRMIWGRYS